MIETKFKQTELGPIPEDWDVMSLNEIGSFSKGAGISRTDSHSGFLPAIRYGEIYTTHHNYIVKYTSHISKEIADASKQIQGGEILFTASGETKEEIGKAVAAPDGVTAYAGGDLIILSPKDGFNSRYLGFISNSEYSVKQKSSLGQGDAVVHISTSKLSHVKIPIPCIQEQEKIAEALSDIDALIRELDVLTEKKKAVLQGTLQELLTGRRRLSGFHEPWCEVAFKDLGYTYNGLSGKTGADFGHGESKFIMFVNVIHKDTISPDYFGSVDISLAEKQNKVQQNDLIFNTSSETPEEVGMCCCVSEEYPNLYLNSFCFGFRFYESNVNARLITFILRSRVGRLLMMELAQGSTRYNLPKRRFLSSSIKLPKDMREQNEIAMILSDMTKEIEELEAKREKYAAIRQGMMQQLLTGKIRLI